MNGPRSALVGLVALGLLAGACSSRALPGGTGDRPRVVATFSIVGDLVRNVGQDHIELRTLVGPGQDIHAFEPSPADSAALAQADLIFENGATLEGWLGGLYAASGSRGRRVVLTERVELRPATAAGSAPTGVSAAEHGELDPHAWLDVANVMVMVEHIREALSEADPAHAAAYAANAAQYVASLQELDAWILAQVGSIPDARRKLVTAHDNFGYFAARYGFEVIGAALPGSTEGASPSAQDLARLVEALKAAEVPVVFAENVSSDALVNQVAVEAQVAVVAPLYTDALGPPGSEADTYLKMMRTNVSRMVAALG